MKRNTKNNFRFIYNGVTEKRLRSKSEHPLSLQEIENQASMHLLGLLQESKNQQANGGKERGERFPSGDECELPQQSMKVIFNCFLSIICFFFLLLLGYDYLTEVFESNQETTVEVAQEAQGEQVTFYQGIDVYLVFLLSITRLHVCFLFRLR